MPTEEAASWYVVLLRDPVLVKGRRGPVWRGRPMGGARAMSATLASALPGLRWARPGTWRGWFRALFDDDDALGFVQVGPIELWVGVHPAGREARVGAWLAGPPDERDRVLSALETTTGWKAEAGFEVSTLPGVARLGTRGLPDATVREAWLDRV